MFIQILSAIHNAGTLLFGIYCSAFFLGVKSNKKNILSLFLLFCVQGSLYLIISAFFGEALALQSYPLIVHLPLILFLSLLQVSSDFFLCFGFLRISLLSAE